MPKIRIVKYTNTMILHEHYCPACEHIHQIAVNQPFKNGAQWVFNGDMENPTFSPSIAVAASMPDVRCHYFIKDGRIEYCGDCYHDYKNKIIDLPHIPEELI